MLLPESRLQYRCLNTECIVNVDTWKYICRRVGFIKVSYYLRTDIILGKICCARTKLKGVRPEITDNDEGCHSESQEPRELLKTFKIINYKKTYRNEDKGKPQIVRDDKVFAERNTVID